jgi:hypothetical protein
MISSLSSRFGRGGGGGNSNNNDNDDDDNNSVYTTVTVETKPLQADPPNNNNRKKSTQIFVSSTAPVRDLKTATNDITKTSIYAKNVVIKKDVALKMLELVRGDNRSWESIAVDILRQKKVRWDSIILDDCMHGSSSSSTSIPITIGGDNNGDDSNSNSNNNEDNNDHDQDQGSDINYLDLILSNIINVDNCSFLHLSNFKSYTKSTSFAMSSIIFSKSLQKLQLDFITDLSKHIPALAISLKENTSITSLITSRCGLNDNHLGILLDNLPKKLEELRIFGNKCRSKGLESLTNHIIGEKKSKNKDKKSKSKKSKHKSTCRLKIIDLSYQHVNTAAGEEFDVLQFSKALSANKTIKVLDLDNTSLDDNQLSYLIDALCRNKTLEELMVNHNKITDEGVALLGSKFGDIKGLKKISMYSNVFDTTPAPTPSPAPTKTKTKTNTNSSTGAKTTTKTTANGGSSDPVLRD